MRQIASAPPGKRMGHAMAIISTGRGTAMEKMEALRKAGTTVIMNPARIRKTVADVTREGAK